MSRLQARMEQRGLVITGNPRPGLTVRQAMLKVTAPDRSITFKVTAIYTVSITLPKYCYIATSANLLSSDKAITEVREQLENCTLGKKNAIIKVVEISTVSKRFIVHLIVKDEQTSYNIGNTFNAEVRKIYTKFRDKYKIALIADLRKRKAKYKGIKT